MADEPEIPFETFRTRALLIARKLAGAWTTEIQSNDMPYEIVLRRTRDGLSLLLKLWARTTLIQVTPWTKPEEKFPAMELEETFKLDELMAKSEITAPIKGVVPAIVEKVITPYSEQLPRIRGYVKHMVARDQQLRAVAEALAVALGGTFEGSFLYNLDGQNTEKHGFKVTWKDEQSKGTIFLYRDTHKVDIDLRGLPSLRHALVLAKFQTEVLNVIPAPAVTDELFLPMPDVLPLQDRMITDAVAAKMGALNARMDRYRKFGAFDSNERAGAALDLMATMDRLMEDLDKTASKIMQYRKETAPS